MESNKAIDLAAWSYFWLGVERVVCPPASTKWNGASMGATTRSCSVTR